MHPDVQVGLGDREAAKMSPHKDFEDFEEYVSLNLGVVFKTLRISQRLGVCEHSSGRSNILYVYEGFHYVKLKDAVAAVWRGACGGDRFFAHNS